MFSIDRCLPALVLAGASCAALAAPPPLPPLEDPASNEHHPGKVVFVELVTPDLDASKHFYGGLFGWTFRDMQSGTHEYAQASLDGRPVAGIMHRRIPSGTKRQPAWIAFFGVADVDAAKATALQHGATVLFEPHTLPARGTEAVFRDPQGAVFAVFAVKAQG